MNDRTSRVRLLLALVGLAAAGSAHAQPAQPVEEGGPVIVGAQEGYKAFELDRFGAAVDTLVQWRRSERTTSGQPDLTDTEQYLLGQIEFDGRAYIGHRNLLELNGAVELGYERTDTDSDVVGETRLDEDFRTLYDVSGLILQEGPAPVTVYARADESRLEREFAGTIDVNSNEYGAFVQLRSEAVPTFFHYFHRESDQTDQFGAVDYNLVQDTFALRSDARIDDQQTLSLEYTFDIVEEQQSRDFTNDFDRHDAYLVHSLDFGPEARHNLRSALRVYDESGQADITRFRIDETLRMKHSEDFDTRYDVTAEDVARHDQDQRYFSGRAQARYRLFESLTAVGAAGISRFEIDDDATTDEYFGDILLEYTKQVPYGRLDAAVGAGYNRQENSERGEPLDVTDDRLVMEDAQPTLIQRRNVVPGSLIVTDLAGFRVYIEGVDYTAVYFPDRVEIRRIVGGAISEGEIVLADYTLGPEPASDIDTPNATFSLRYTLEETFLKGISPYMYYQWIDQEISTIDPTLFTPEELHDLRYGVDYYLGNLVLNAERQNHDSTIFPFDKTHLEARYNLRITPASALSASLTHETTDFNDDGDRLDLDRATLRYYGRLGERLDFNLQLLYRDETSRFSADSTGFEQFLDLTWRRGKTTITAGFRNTMLDSEPTDTLSQEVSVGLRRAF